MSSGTTTGFETYDFDHFVDYVTISGLFRNIGESISMSEVSHFHWCPSGYCVCCLVLLPLLSLFIVTHRNYILMVLGVHRHGLGEGRFMCECNKAFLNACSRIYTWEDIDCWALLRRELFFLAIQLFFGFLLRQPSRLTTPNRVHPIERVNLCLALVIVWSCPVEIPATVSI